MFLISAEKFSLWKKKQISKGGDTHSLNLLIDSLGGLSNIELNLLKIKSEKVLKLNLDLDFIDTIYREKFKFGKKEEIIIKLK